MASNGIAITPSHPLTVQAGFRRRDAGVSKFFFSKKKELTQLVFSGNTHVIGRVQTKSLECKVSGPYTQGSLGIRGLVPRDGITV